MNELTRYRVIGAVFLLAIAIIVLPMVFDGQGVQVKQLPQMTEPLPPVPSDAQLDALKISAAQEQLHAEEVAVTSALLDKDGFATDGGTRIGDPELREPDAEDTPGQPVVEQPVTKNPADTPAPDPVVAEAPVADNSPPSAELRRRAPPVAERAAPPGATSLAKRPIWAVQLASFASQANARALRDELLGDGFEAWTSTARQDSAVRTRVAIGPLLDRRDAERMRDLVSERYEVSAIVVHMEP